MHGLGNDFVVINAIQQTVNINPLSIPALADRHLGIGFDQLLIIEHSSRADFFCRFFNADGTEAEQCGNGVRCAARFIHEEKLTLKKTFLIETLAGLIEICIPDYDHIRAAMGIPCFDPEALSHELDLDVGLRVQAAVLSMGNPHTILRVPALSESLIIHQGPKIAHHPAFPKGTNVGFMEVINRQHIRLRTFERGAGLTLACGSNACAAVVVGIMNDWLDHSVRVELIHGNLLIEWAGKNQPVIMTGPASHVYKGEMNF
jgi:diaminopimelate epimerase